MAVQGARSALAVITTFIAGGVMFILQRRRSCATSPATSRRRWRDAALPKSIQWFYARRRSWCQPDDRRARRRRATSRAARSRSTSRARCGRATTCSASSPGMVVLVAMIVPRRPARARARAARAVATTSTSCVDAAAAGPEGARDRRCSATLVFAAVPLAFSALIANARYALALWAAYYLVFGWMRQPARTRVARAAIGALDLATALDAVALRRCSTSSCSAGAPGTSRSDDRARLDRAPRRRVAIAILGYQVRARARRGRRRRVVTASSSPTTAASGTATCSAISDVSLDSCAAASSGCSAPTAPASRR